MSDQQRTAQQIQAYCEAASEGPWEPIWIDDFENIDEIVAYVEEMLKQGGTDFYFALAKNEGGKQICPVTTGNGPTSGANLHFACAARTDLLPVLGAAEHRGLALRRILANCDDGEIVKAWATNALADTAWLAESKEEADGST